MNSEANQQLPAFARYWARELGTSEKSLMQFQGGINNRVFRCGEEPNQWVIKGYSPLEPDQRDRMQAEVDFLNYATQVAPGFTPELIQTDPEQRCIVLENLKGTRYLEGIEPHKDDVDAAVNFLRLLNADPKSARKAIVIEAAEGFLSLSQHLLNLQERLEKLECGQLHEKARFRAENILKKLKNQLDNLQGVTENLIEKGVVRNQISPNERWISPSDYGFHNAIRTQAGVKFIDFEFAGWDDPIKTAADFVLQPLVPIKSRKSPLLDLITRKEDEKSVLKRYNIMYKIIYLKWISIMLGVLNPTRLKRILDVSVMPNKVLLFDRQIKRVECYIDLYDSQDNFKI